MKKLVDDARKDAELDESTTTGRRRKMAIEIAEDLCEIGEKGTEDWWGAVLNYIEETQEAGRYESAEIAIQYIEQTETVPDWAKEHWETLRRWKDPQSLLEDAGTHHSSRVQAVRLAQVALEQAGNPQADRWGEMLVVLLAGARKSGKSWKTLAADARRAG